MQRSRSLARASSTLEIAFLASAMLATSLACAQESATLDRIRSNGRITLGYYSDAVPLSYQEEGKPQGYAMALCDEVVNDLKTSLGLESLATEAVLVGTSERFNAVSEGRVDLLCGPSVKTLSREKEVSFSIPILVSGTAVMLRTDAPAQFRDTLEDRPVTAGPLWRGSPGLAALQDKRFVVVSGTTAETIAKERRDQLKVNATIRPVSDSTEGALEVRQGRADAMLGELYVLLNLANKNRDKLVVLDRLIDVQPLALAMARGDDEFRLQVDKTLSRLYRTGQFAPIYEKYFGKPSSNTLQLFRMLAVPE
jgi:polar amino acid transport system substrate-binding protein